MGDFNTLGLPEKEVNSNLHVANIDSLKSTATPEEWKNLLADVLKLRNAAGISTKVWGYRDVPVYGANSDAPNKELYQSVWSRVNALAQKKSNADYQKSQDRLASLPGVGNFASAAKRRAGELY